MFDVSKLESEKYISLETYKKNKEAVRTPVWFVIKNDLVYVLTRDQTGKIKRLKNNQNVKIATCNIKGKITGELTKGTAKILSDSETSEVSKWRDKKYGFFSRVAKVLTKSKGKIIAISIKIN